jgi:hypothetical protein
MTRQKTVNCHSEESLTYRFFVITISVGSRQSEGLGVRDWGLGVSVLSY